MAYAETDADYALEDEYAAKVTLIVTNEYGVTVANNIAYDNGSGIASVELDFAGEAVRTYTAVGRHYVQIYLYDFDDYAPYERFYYDNWYFTNFESQGIYEPFYFTFTRPSYSYFQRRTHRVKSRNLHINS